MSKAQILGSTVSTGGPLADGSIAFSEVTGTAAISQGGTGATSSASALTNLGAIAAAGGITTVSIVSSLPGSPDANTLYIVTA